MKHIFTLALGTLVLAACHNGKSQDNEATIDKTDIEAQAPAEVRMETLSHAGAIQSAVADQYRVLRVPCDSLPKVTDTDGTIVVDNTLRLTLTKQGATVFDRTFTKRDFPEAGSHNLYKISVLEDIAWQESSSSSAHFMAFLRNPWEEESLTYAVTIAPGGQLTITHVVVDEMTDAEPTTTPEDE